MAFVDLSTKEKLKKTSHIVSDTIREQLIEHTKDFKTSWLELGQKLYTVWQDKFYQAWGFEKFEEYTSRELGLKKDLCVKLLKTYFFIEQDEPEYLKEDFLENKEASRVPGFEAMNVLRMAKQKKEVLNEDYMRLKKNLFEKGADASQIRKDLTAIIKERKVIDPIQERDQRNEVAIRKLLNSLRSFKKDTEVLKLLPHEIINHAILLIEKLEVQILAKK